MTGKKRAARDALDRLADALADDVLAASDQELLAEFQYDGQEPGRVAGELRSLFEKSVLASNRRKLVAAKAAVARVRTETSSPSVPVDIAAARALLRGVLEEPSTSARLTMAARKESEMSDADVVGMLEDLRALGVIPGSDNGNGTA